MQGSISFRRRRQRVKHRTVIPFASRQEQDMGSRKQSAWSLLGLVDDCMLNEAPQTMTSRRYFQLPGSRLFRPPLEHTSVQPRSPRVN